MPTYKTDDKNKPVPIGLDTLPFDGSPDAPPKEVEPTDDTDTPPPVDPVEGAQPEEMRFNAGEYASFVNALSQANLGNVGYTIGDFFRRDPESSEESPMYLYTGSPVNFYGGYGENKKGQSVKITSGDAIFVGGKRKGETIGKDFVVSDFIRQLKMIDESS
tara:strand:+ start:61 stop:543 length:483 start_codon:yes stop_codon:yes gene_type:complete